MKLVLNYDKLYIFFIGRRSFDVLVTLDRSEKMKSFCECNEKYMIVWECSNFYNFGLNLYIRTFI